MLIYLSILVSSFKKEFYFQNCFLFKLSTRYRLNSTFSFIQHPKHVEINAKTEAHYNTAKSSGWSYLQRRKISVRSPLQRSKISLWSSLQRSKISMWSSLQRSNISVLSSLQGSKFQCGTHSRQIQTSN